jgi:hypothetical protein
VLAQNIFGLFFKGIVNQSNSRIITSKSWTWIEV